MGTAPRAAALGAADTRALLPDLEGAFPLVIAAGAFFLLDAVVFLAEVFLSAAFCFAVVVTADFSVF